MDALWPKDSQGREGIFKHTSFAVRWLLCINRGGRLPLKLSPERFILHSTMILQILLEPRSSNCNALAMIVAFKETVFCQCVIMIKLWCLYCPGQQILNICEKKTLGSLFHHFFGDLSSTISHLSLHFTEHKKLIVKTDFESKVLFCKICLPSCQILLSSCPEEEKGHQTQ